MADQHYPPSYLSSQENMMLNQYNTGQNMMGMQHSQQYGQQQYGMEAASVMSTGMMNPQSMSQTMAQNIPQSMPQSIQQNISQNLSQAMAQTIPQNISQTIPQSMSQTMSQNIPQTMQQTMSQTIVQNMPQNITQNIAPNMQVPQQQHYQQQMQQPLDQSDLMQHNDTQPSTSSMQPSAPPPSTQQAEPKTIALKDISIDNLYKLGQKTLQEIVLRMQDLFNTMKLIQPPNGIQQGMNFSNEKKIKLQEQIKFLKVLFKHLRIIYERSNESCQLHGLEYTHTESLIPLKENYDKRIDDKRQPDVSKATHEESRELIELVTLRNRQLREVIFHLRLIISEVNTMISMRRS